MVDKQALFAIAISLAGLLAFPSLALADGEWEFNDEEDGISIYIRDVDDSDFNEIKAIAVLECTTDEIWDLLTDAKTFVKVMPSVTKSERIDTCGEECYIIYQYLELDGIDDRQYILEVRASITQKDGVNEYTRKWKVSDRKPEPLEDVVTVEHVKGKWKLRSVDGGKKTKFTYQNHIDVGGSVPSVLANERAEDNALQYLKNVRKACE